MSRPSVASIMSPERAALLASSMTQMDTTFGSSSAKASDPAAGVKKNTVAAAKVSDDELVTLVSKALEQRMRSTASSHDALLDEKNSLSAVLQFSFTWRKPPTEAETALLKAAAAKAGKPYVAENISKAPMPVRFDVETLNRAFGGKINFAKEQYLLAAYIESAHSSAPYPLNFTLHGVQGKPLTRVTSNDGTAATMTLHPQTTWTSEQLVYRMSNVDAESLYTFGNVDLKAEVEALTRPAGTTTYFVPASRFIGKMIAANHAEISKTSTVDYVKKADLFMVEENVVADILAKFHDQVLMDLKTTDFSAIEGVLTRADRADSQSKEFADASDAAGIVPTRTALEAVHSQKNLVTVNVRLHAIDPAKLRKSD
jgi:hypothetical protein